MIIRVSVVLRRTVCGDFESKSPQTVLLRTTLTRMIIIYVLNYNCIRNTPNSLLKMILLQQLLTYGSSEGFHVFTDKIFGLIGKSPVVFDNQLKSSRELLLMSQHLKSVASGEGGAQNC